MATSTAQSNGGATSNPLPDHDNLELKNQCEQSRSPYVRSHATNPIAWQLYTPQTLSLARTHSRLIFLSIGYSACHWCHVMSTDAFSSPAIASLLNTSFIPIKLDREERPDIDRIYMNYVQATTAQGGWPLNVFLTPDLQPIFGGTFFPGPESDMLKLGDVKGFQEVAERVLYMWQTQRERCLASAKAVTAQLKEFAAEGTISGGIRNDNSLEDNSNSLDLELLEEAYEHFKSKYDSVYGGFGTTGPKFPTPMNLQFLLELGQLPSVVRDVVGERECEEARNMAVRTLKAMARGGIKDQVGMGFARYSVTRDWGVPHFEKMLPDQAQLLTNYLTAFLLTGDSDCLNSIYDISTYLTTPSTSGGLLAPTGGFFSSEDADSYPSTTISQSQAQAQTTTSSKPQKVEGAFYTFTLEDLSSALPNPTHASIAAAFYGITSTSTSTSTNPSSITTASVLSITTTPEALSAQFSLPKDEIISILKSIRTQLRTWRETNRPRPALDDKIVVSWNGLAISALARTSCALSGVDEGMAERCRRAAVEAVRFLRGELWEPPMSGEGEGEGGKEKRQGQLYRIYREGRGETKAFADDYAFLILGLCDLYEATWDDGFLEWADELMQLQIHHFHDPLTHGFFSTPSPSLAPDTLLRLKDGLDASEPSTNGVTISNLLRLSTYTSHAPYTALAHSTLAAFSNEIEQHPFLFPSMLPGVVAARVGMRSLVVTGSEEECREVVQRVGKRVRPLWVVVRVGGGARSEWLRERSEVLRAVEGEKAGVLVCEGRSCRNVALGEVERVF